MYVFLIIYLIIGAISGCIMIYLALHDEEILNDEKEMNGCINNCGTVIVFIIIVFVALLIAFLWPLAYIYGILKKSKKERK